MFCVFISPTAFVDLFSREVASILKAFNLPTNRVQPPLRPTPMAFSFFITAVSRASSLSVQWLRGNEYPSWLLGIPRRGQAATHQWEAGRRAIWTTDTVSGHQQRPKCILDVQVPELEVLFLSIWYYYCIHLPESWHYLTNTELLKYNIFSMMNTGKDTIVNLQTQDVGTCLPFSWVLWEISA